MDFEKCGSLARFLESQGPRITGIGALRNQPRVNLMVARIMMGVACIFPVVAFATHDASVAVGATGPLIAGLTNFIVYRTMRSRKTEERRPRWKVDDEVKDFVSTLQVQFLRSRRVEFGPRRRTYLINPLAIDAFERLAFAFNRAMGLLDAMDGESWTAAAEGAIQESTIEGLQAIARINRFPETAETAQRSLDVVIGKISDLGDQVERLQLDPNRRPAASTAKIDRVLDDLRLENLARIELAPEETQRRLDQR